MPSPKRCCIFLAGAPEIDDLSWDERHLLTDFKLPIKRFLEEEGSQDIIEATPPSTYAKWRKISLNDERIRFDNANPALTQFLSFDKAHSSEDQNDFLEQSMAVLDDIDAAHLIPRTAIQDQYKDSTVNTTFMTTTSFTTSFGSATSGSSHNISPIKTAGNLELSNRITDLKQIPNAEYITRIQPQTITVNIVVGIISVSSTRRVQLRRRDAMMDIVDVTVGDNTRAGFNISFWLIPVESHWKPTDDLRWTLNKLRAGDVVVVNNVALSCFNGCVYGQSLSRRFARNSTAISIVDDCSDGAEPLQSIAKVKRVREWTGDFVGAPSKKRAVDKTNTTTTSFGERPPDTNPDDT